MIKTEPIKMGFPGGSNRRKLVGRLGSEESIKNRVQIE